MIFREAQVSDIKEIQLVRLSVKENVLSNPDLVTDEECELFITQRGKGWVCEVENQVVGFSIVDLAEHNIWALFVRPEFEKQGVGRKLHDLMMTWYFSQTQEKVWLGTEQDSRAERFYRIAGWEEVGMSGVYEIKLEMTHEIWLENRRRMNE